MKERKKFRSASVEHRESLGEKGLLARKTNIQYATVYRRVGVGSIKLRQCAKNTQSRRRRRKKRKKDFPSAPTHALTLSLSLARYTITSTVSTDEY